MYNIYSYIVYTHAKTFNFSKGEGHEFEKLKSGKWKGVGGRNGQGEMM